MNKIVIWVFNVAFIAAIPMGQIPVARVNYYESWSIGCICFSFILSNYLFFSETKIILKILALVVLGFSVLAAIDFHCSYELMLDKIFPNNM